MISFVVFKLAVMLFTSFSGTSLVIVGVFALIYRYETFASDPPTTHLNQLYYGNGWFLPLVLIRRHPVRHHTSIQVPQGLKGLGGLIPNSGRFFNFSQRKLPNLTSKVS